MIIQRLNIAKVDQNHLVKPKKNILHCTNNIHIFGIVTHQVCGASLFKNNLHLLLQ